MGFGVLLVTALVLEAAARRGAGPATAAETLGAVLRTTPGRVVVLLAWVWLGVHFLAR
ncbi:DUF6186 family protein [Geodermatophilus sp. DSM 44513]|uniref:DUF6186 family protein n=1 Tax=Geodermatophilus sp. DSM 44513 TaxID=1528104 RepID=UPI0028F6D7DA|nr:DUF6186 family protein [Geodermatophilus sp. DSM 44513]WNV73665.1 DUF6186 family protein [Geodermatophilus sp. DSM 44513]